MEKMRSLKVKEDRFELLKETLVRDLENFNKEQPYHHAMYAMNHCLQHPFDEVSTRQNRPKADILPMSRRRPGTARSSKDNADSSKPH